MAVWFYAKRSSTPPPLDQDDLGFHYTFNELEHGERLRQELDLSHLSPEQGDQLSALIKRY